MGNKSQNTVTKPLKAIQLLRKRSDFTHRFWGSYNASRKSAYLARDAAQVAYDKELQALEDWALFANKSTLHG